jgi:CubicO group peptidase (beta-lactamase class C family)
MPTLLALLLALVPPDTARRPPPRTIPELEARITEILKETHTPGMAIAVVTRDSVRWVAGLGKADVASGRDATAETLFRIGSVSKAFTSLLVMLVAGEGKLRLDDPIKPYVPDVAYQNRWEATDPVRIVHLLEHTTGWDDMALRDYALNDSTLTLAQGLAFNPKTRTSRWRPGTRVSYCNSGPAVAAHILERLEGQPIEQLVHDRLFVPMGMTTATYLRPDPGLPAATLYHADGHTPFPYWYVSERPAGSINASARDMAAYVRFLLNRGRVRGRVVVPRAAIERMERPESSLGARAGITVGYGLSLLTVVGDSGFLWVEHTGGVPGGLTDMVYRPDAGVGFAFMINSDNGRAFERLDRVLRAYLVAGVPRPVPPAPAPLSPLARRWAGWYVMDNPRVQGLYFLMRLVAVGRLTVGDSGLTFKPLIGKRARYVPVTPTLYRATRASVANLALVDDSADGRPVALERFAGGMPRSYRRTAFAAVAFPLLVAVLFLLGTVATMLFALVWVPRRLWGKLRGAPGMSARVWPLAAALAFALVTTLSALSGEDAISRLGMVTPWSIGVFLGTLVFPLASLVGYLAAVRASAAAVGRGVRNFALGVGVLNVLVTLYLAWWGIIGWRTWT